MRGRVGSDSHIDAGPQVIAEILHHLAITGERRRAMGDRAAAIGDQPQISPGPPADPGVGIEKQRVTEDRARSEYADLLRPLDRRFAMAPDHLLHLAYA